MRAHRPIITAGTILGVGMGGFVDGILLHQILQLHSMLSAVRPRDSVVNIEVNMFWDGLFHAGTWIATAIGLALLWRAARTRAVPLVTRVLCGSLLMGWGLFNVVEGVIDHHILQIHHVYENAGLSVFDAAFLAASGLMLVGGALMVRAGARAADANRAMPPLVARPAMG